MKDKQELIERLDEIRQEHEDLVMRDLMTAEEAFWKMSGHLLTLYYLNKESDKDE